jgi:hypothetical protein
LNLPDDEALNQLRRRLKAAGCEVSDVVDHDFIRSVSFTDPNGIALEASVSGWDEPSGSARIRHQQLLAVVLQRYGTPGGAALSLAS